MDLERPGPGDPIERERLSRRLRAAATLPTLPQAPAGYGKAARLGQWACLDPRPFAPVTLADAHNDPAASSAYVDAGDGRRVEALADRAAGRALLGRLRDFGAWAELRVLRRKTQIRSAYLKLGVSSRHEAVEACRAAGSAPQAAQQEDG